MRSNPIRYWFLWISILVLLPQACFRKFLLRDSDIAEHYRTLPVKPIFGFYPANDSLGVYYATSGTDTLPLVVFIHGAPGGWYGYMEYIDDSLLQQHMQLVSVDRPGYGKSAAHGAVTSIAEQARRLHPLIDSLRHGRPVLVVGRSYGAPIAARLAADYPVDVSALLLIAPAVDPALEKFWWFSGALNSAAMRWMLPAAVNRASDEKYAHAQELRALEPCWDSLRMPVTVVQGDADVIVDTANFTYLRRKLTDPRNTFIRLPGVGHLVTKERPDLVRQLLLTTVGSLKKH